MRFVRRFWPLALLLAAVAAAWASGLAQQISWAGLARNQAALGVWVGSHPIAAPALYVAIYAVAVALSVPESAVLTVAGGLLFGTLLGGVLVVIGSTTGAVALFLAVRHHLADAIARRGGRFLDRVRAGLERDGFSYLLAIRLVPAFPFWLVNLAAALSGMRLLPYAAATLIGVVPATFVLCFDRRRHRRGAGRRRQTRPGDHFLPSRSWPAGRPGGTVAAAGRVAAVETIGCLNSIWR